MPKKNYYREVQDSANEIRRLYDNGGNYRQALYYWSKLTRTVRKAPSNEQPILHSIMVESGKLIDEMKKRDKDH